VRTLAGRGRLAVALAAAAVAGAVAAGCGEDEEAQKGAQGGDPARARFTLNVGDIVPLTGDLSPFGPPGRKAADLAVRQANDALRQGGAQGVQLRIQHADEETSPQAAVSAARRLLAGDATCLAGAWASADTIPVAESVAGPRRIPLISPASTSAQITNLNDGGFVFRTAPSDDLQGETLADVVEEELRGARGKTISVAGRNDAYGQGLTQSFQRAWEGKGGRVAGPVLYDPDQPSYNSEAGRITSGNPAGYVIVDFPETYARVGPALVRTGRFDASKLFVTDGLAGEELPRNIPGESLEGARGTRPGTPERGQAAQAFGRLYRQSKLPPKERQTFDAQNFDAVTLCALGALAAGSNEGEAIQGKLRDVSGPPGRPVTFEQLDEGVRLLRQGQDIDYQGASGPIDLDDKGDPTSATYEVFSYGPDRRFEVDRQVEAERGQGVTEGGQ